MPEYGLGFSERPAGAAHIVVAGGLEPADAKRVVLCLCPLSCEIALKALLEEAGLPVAEIVEGSHGFRKLLTLFGECEVHADIANGSRPWGPAAQRTPGSALDFQPHIDAFLNTGVSPRLSASH